jgi:LmbE family N-acetylglucosaminyl deacetylase
MTARRLLAVLAHPDDESFLMGGTLARYAAEGVDIRVVTATRGEAGRGDRDPEQNGRRRERELRAAIAVLGVRSLEILGYPDGGLARLPRSVLVRRVMDTILAWAPDVVLTFGPDGISGHADHLAIGEATADAAASVGGKIRLFQVVPSPATRQSCRRGSETFDATGLTAVDISEHRLAKVRAMQSHASQSQPFCGSAESVAPQLVAHEYFRLTWPPTAGPCPSDLFESADVPVSVW